MKSQVTNPVFGIRPGFVTTFPAYKHRTDSASVSFFQIDINNRETYTRPAVSCNELNTSTDTVFRQTVHSSYDVK